MSVSFGIQYHSCSLFQKLESLAKHNFLPCVYGLGAQAMITNAPQIIKIFGTCAPVCLVGPSGRGKTLTMKMAQALVGKFH